MSIGGIVETVHINEDGSGRLKLKPAKKGEPTGQSELHFRSAPEEVTGLNGRLIWGGDSSIMYGQSKIAKRIGYTEIEFLSGFKEKMTRENNRV